MAELIGRTLGNYRIESLLGSGGMGQVFLGVHLHLQRQVAIKVLRHQFDQDPSFRARFLQEARAAAALSHPNIVQVYDFGEFDERFYLVMELVADGSLRSLQPRDADGNRQALPLPLALDLVRQAAEALDYAHRRGMVHRDVKPDNLLLARVATPATPDGGYLLKISDFGLARLAEGGVSTVTGITMGTPAYMSPEQCQGLDLDGRSDVYSLGVVLYEATTGYVPFQVKGLSDAVFKHVYTPPPPPREMRADLPADLEVVILRCLAKAPSERFATAGELADALRAVAAAFTGAAEVPGVAEPATGDAGTAQTQRRAALSVELADDALALTPGQLTITNVIVRNSGDQPEQVRIDLEGVPEEWVTSPPPDVRLAPNAQASIAVPVLVPAMDQSSGTYRVRVRAATAAEPDVEATDEARWTVTPALAAHARAGAAATGDIVAAGRGGRRVSMAAAALTALVVLVAGAGVLLVLTRDGAGDGPPNQVIAGAPTGTPTATQPTPSSEAPTSTDVAVVPTETAPLPSVTVAATPQVALPTETPPSTLPVGASPVPVEPFDIAFTTGRGDAEPFGSLDIYVMRADGSGQRALIDQPGDDWTPAWSPDGRRIAWVSKRDGNDEIYVANADGTAQTRVTDYPGDDRFPEWSPDGQYIAFSRTLDGDEELFVVDADGSDEVRLTDHQGYDGFLAWSPDGSRIAYTSGIGGDNEIVVITSDGAIINQLTDNAANDYNPVWSPDGSRIAFVSNRDGNDEIYLMNADGSAQENLTATEDAEFNPSFSPDGTRLAYARREGDTIVLKVYDLGTGELVVAAAGLADDPDIQWSADARWIAFLRQGETFIDIYVVKSSGEGERQLTTNPTFDGGVDWVPVPTGAP